MAVNFKFPDEEGNDGPNKKTVEDQMEIKIVDDTPEDDRGREPLPEKIKQELEEDDLEEYSEKVKLRMKQLRKLAHDERRSKEAAARERDEAIQVARQREHEANNLKQRLGAGEKIFVSEMTTAAKSRIDNAKLKLKQALDAGDSDLIVAAQEELNAAQFKQKEIESFKPSLQDDKSTVNSNPQAQTPPRVDPKAEAWRNKNTWFGVDEEMTALSLALHEKLVKSGVNPSSDEYYQKIDSTIRKRFPENFSDEDAPTPREPSRRSSTVVAAASRSTGPRQVTLKASQAAIAKRLGITNEAYAKEFLKLEQNNG